MKNKKTLKIAVGILAVLLVALIGIVVALELGEDDVPRIDGVPVRTEPEETQNHTPVETTNPAETIPPVQTAPETEPVVYGGNPVETPCGILYLPDNWDMSITAETVSEDPTVIDFLAQGEKLYSLAFSDDPDGAFGQVTVDGRVIYVGMEICELDEADDLLLSMQESINELLAQLSPEPVSSRPVETEPVVSDILIETAYGDLLFPGKWEDNLQVEQPDEKTVEFYGCVKGHAPVLLFTLNYESENGDIMMELVTEDHAVVSLGIDISEIEFEGMWNDEEMDLIYSMQEDMNYLMDSLLG